MEVSLNRDRLIKLLNLTSSLNDHEALSAVRMANEMISKCRMTWEDVLVHKTDPVREFQQRKYQKYETKKTSGAWTYQHSSKDGDDHINEEVEAILKWAAKPSRNCRFTEWERDFFRSTAEQYRIRGVLSFRQIEVLRNLRRKYRRRE